LAPAKKPFIDVLQPAEQVELLVALAAPLKVDATASIDAEPLIEYEVVKFATVMDTPTDAWPKLTVRLPKTL
jgi:hypothetical protein